MDLLKIWEILVRRMWIIIQAFLVIFIAVAVCTMMMKPLYKSSAVVYYKQGDSLSSVFSSLMSDMGLDSFTTILSSGDEINDKAVLAQTSPILEKVISRLQLRDGDGNLLTAEKLLKPGIKSIFVPLEKIAVAVVADTNTIQITANAKDPLEAQYIANTLADVFIEYTKDDVGKEIKTAHNFVTDQIDAVKISYRKVLEELAEYQKKEEVVSLSNEMQVAIAKMADMYTQKQDATLDIMETKARIIKLKEQLAKEAELSGSSKPISYSPLLEKLYKDLTDLNQKLASELEDKTEKHPDVVIIKKKIAQLEQEIASQMSVYQQTSPDLTKLEQELISYQTNLNGINADIETYKKILLTLPDKAAGLAELQLAVKAGEQIYQTLLENEFEMGIMETMSLSDIVLIQPAPLSTKSVRPKVPLNLALGIILGLITGISLAFLFEYLDDTLKTHDDVSKLTNITFLGTIPQYKYLRNHKISEIDPRDPMAEVYRTARNSLQFATLDAPPKIILVTSAGPSEGKSTTAVNLSISFAGDGKKTLILGSDLRKPGIKKFFNLDSLKGITTILSDNGSIEDCVQKTEVDNLYLLSSGPIPPDPGKIIESDKYKNMLAKLREKFDIIIIDSPPSLIVNDAVNLSKISDCTILVLESGKLSKHAFISMLDLFKNAQIEPKGIILNKFKITRVGYYSKYYRTYYAEK